MTKTKPKKKDFYEKTENMSIEDLKKGMFDYKAESPYKRYKRLKKAKSKI